MCDWFNYQLNFCYLYTGIRPMAIALVKPPFFKIQKVLKPSFLGLQAWFTRNETLIQ